MSKEYFSPDEVAEIFGVSGNQIRKLCKGGKIDFVKIGASYRIPAAAVEKMKAPAPKKAAVNDHPQLPGMEA